MRRLLSTEQVSNLFKLPLSCVEVEYPNKLGQVLKSQMTYYHQSNYIHPSMVVLIGILQFMDIGR